MTAIPCRRLLVAFLVLGAALPVQGVQLVCAVEDRAPMAVHACCCLDGSDDPTCSLRQLTTWCCDLRPALRDGTAQALAVGERSSTRALLDGAALCQSSAPRLRAPLLEIPVAPHRLGGRAAPAPLYLQHQSLLI